MVNRRWHRTPRLPSANSPQRVVRLLETVARGIRTARALREALAVETPDRPQLRATRHALARASPRLESPSSLTPLGLAYVYGGSRRQALYVQGRVVQSRSPPSCW